MSIAMAFTICATLVTRISFKMPCNTEIDSLSVWLEMPMPIPTSDPPIMSAAERCAEVEACKAGTKVIPNAPCFGLTKEFLDEHQIHVVAYGEEDLERFPNPKDDPYYRVPREMGIARPLPRTQGLSTSDLIRRIQKARPADQKKSPT